MTSGTIAFRESPHPWGAAARAPDKTRKPRIWPVFLLVAAAQLAFGMWLNSLGYRLADALSRSGSALAVLWSTDPHLAAIGFVWMPLPTLLELPWAVLYPLWHDVVSSGFASTATTALCGGATAAILVKTASLLGLPTRLGWAFALLVSLNPMLLLYAGNGMSEGVAAPFLIGAVCLLTLFWRTGQRGYIAWAGLALAFGCASLYQGVPFTLAVFGVMASVLVWGREAVRSAPQGRWRAVQGLGLLLLAPSAIVMLLWVVANAAIMKDPLYFATSVYSNAAQTAVARQTPGGLPFIGQGDVGRTLAFCFVRTAALSVPVVALLVVRGLDRRLQRVETLALVLLWSSVPLGFMAPLTYRGGSFGWLRFFIYPLLVAAGWGLYEVATSHRPRRAIAIILAGWVLASPVTLAAMANPELGQEEHRMVQVLAGERHPQDLRRQDHVPAFKPMLSYLESEPLARGQRILLDPATQAWPLVAQLEPQHLRRLVVVTADRQFAAAVADPVRHNISYLLVPDPRLAQSDAINRLRPGLWEGRQPGFELEQKFPPRPRVSGGEWRLYKVKH